MDAVGDDNKRTERRGDQARDNKGGRAIAITDRLVEECQDN